MSRPDKRLHAAMRAVTEMFPRATIAIFVQSGDPAPGERVNIIANGEQEDIRVMLERMAEKLKVSK